MIESLIIALREGIEAALVVALIVAFLRKEGLTQHLRAVWAGLGAAVLASFAGGLLLRSWAIDEELFEGVLYLVSAVLVGSMLIWMWRHGRRLPGDIKSGLGRIVERGDRTPGGLAGGLFLFTFLMVFREGVETVLFLSAVSLTTSGLMAAAGALIGIALAVVFGVLFTRGSLHIDFGRFLKVSAAALLIFVLQLLVNGYHELAEAGVVPASRATMATIGPLVRHEIFFIVAILALPLLALAMPGQAPAQAAAANPAEERLRRAQAQRSGRARVLAGVLGVLAITVLGMDVAYSQPAELSAPVALVPQGDWVQVPVSTLADGGLHRFVVHAGGQEVRFIALQVEPGRVVAALDACVICGSAGYVREGAEVLCRHCHSAVYPPSIGQAGGCNPIPLAQRVVGGTLEVSLAALAGRANLFAAGATAAHH